MCIFAVPAVLRDVYATENTDSQAYIRAARLLASILEQRKDYNGRIHYLISTVSGELTGGIIDLRSHSADAQLLHQHHLCLP